MLVESWARRNVKSEVVLRPKGSRRECGIRSDEKTQKLKVGWQE